MLNNINIESDKLNNNFLNHLNPAIKIFSILIMVILSILTNNIFSHILIIIIILGIILLSNDTNYYLKLLNKLKYFLFFLFIFDLFFTNIFTCIIHILRIVEIIFYSQIILRTTKTSELNEGLTTLCLPFKIFKLNPLFLSMSITLTIHFIPMIINEMNNTIKSLKIRGIYFNKNIKRNIIIIEKLIVPIFKRTTIKADMLATVMSSKGFSFEKKRSNYFKNGISIYDILYIGLFIILSYLIIRGEI